jgi:ketosteroid isomerase-like protein
MSQENVEIVRQVYDAFERRDTQLPFDMYAADIEWDLSVAGMLGPGGVYHGHEEVRESFRDLLTAFSFIDFEVEEITEAGDRVLATIHERHVGRASGVEVDRRHYAVWTLRHGKVTRMCVYLDRADALEAVGLQD